MTMTQQGPHASNALRAHVYAALLVHAEPGFAASHRIRMAAALARDLDARLVGLGAEAIDSLPAPDPMGYSTGEWFVLMQEQVNNHLQAAEKGFRQDAAGADAEWRSAQDFPTRAMARTARAADLLIVSPQGKGGKARGVDPAELVMTAGRPVLMVPEAARQLQATAILVAWKDTREARRAVSDALPLLRRAEDVVVQAVRGADEDDEAAFETGDVVAALKRHGVNARAAVAHARPSETTEALIEAAARASADLIVAGAYGHSRAREWVFGGVTYDLLHRPPSYVMFSH